MNRVLLHQQLVYYIYKKKIKLKMSDSQSKSSLKKVKRLFLRVALYQVHVLQFRAEGYGLMLMLIPISTLWMSKKPQILNVQCHVHVRAFLDLLCLMNSSSEGPQVTAELVPADPPLPPPLSLGSPLSSSSSLNQGGMAPEWTLPTRTSTG